MPFISTTTFLTKTSSVTLAVIFNKLPALKGLGEALIEFITGGVVSTANTIVNKSIKNNKVVSIKIPI